jgi:replication factor A1
MDDSPAPEELAMPVFTTVDGLRPGANLINLVVKVLEAKEVISRPRKGVPLTVTECLVGDSTGVVVFTARNDQIETAEVGSYITLRNAKVDMFKGSMRLAVDEWGVVEKAEADFKPKVDYNLSLVEYELVSV